MALILVDAHSVTSMKSGTPRPEVLFEIARATVTGDAPKVARVRPLGEDEL